MGWREQCSAEGPPDVHPGVCLSEAILAVEVARAGSLWRTRTAPARPSRGAAKPPNEEVTATPLTIVSRDRTTTITRRWPVDGRLAFSPSAALRLEIRQD